MSTIIQFDRKAYFNKKGPLLAAIFLISLIFDLVIVWNLSIGLPENVAMNSEILQIWKIAFGFLLLLNTLLLKFWNVLHFYKDLSRWQSGYVEICANEIIHCEEQRHISQKQVVFKRGYVPDNSKQVFEYVLKYQINQVEKFEKTLSGKLKITGNIMMDCLDEYIGFELGIEDQATRQLSVHTIPPYYDGMELIQLKLEEMVSKN